MLVLMLRYRNMIVVSVLSFYFGCLLTSSFVRIDCVHAKVGDENYLKTESKNEFYEGQNEVEYAVLILSGIKNTLQRDTIRATWMNLAHNIVNENGVRLYRWQYNRSTLPPIPEFIKFYFAIGTKNLPPDVLTQLHAENDRSKDLLLIETLEDSYQNLTSKVMESFAWFNKKLPRLKYVIKCDDDSFVRVDLIVKDLEAFAPEMNDKEIGQYVSVKEPISTKGLYWGYMDGRAHVQLGGKWKERNWFLCDNYLPYALGGGYVVSKSVVDYIANNAHMFSHYNSEDVSMGVWTSALDINRVHDTRFDTEYRSRGCSNDMLVRHKQDSRAMFDLYKILAQSRGERLCDYTKQSVPRTPYKYKWHVLPSACCR